MNPGLYIFFFLPPGKISLCIDLLHCSSLKSSLQGSIRTHRANGHCVDPVDFRRWSPSLGCLRDICQGLHPFHEMPVLLIFLIINSRELQAKLPHSENSSSAKYREFLWIYLPLPLVRAEIRYCKMSKHFVIAHWLYQNVVYTVSVFLINIITTTS